MERVTVVGGGGGETGKVELVLDVVLVDGAEKLVTALGGVPVDPGLVDAGVLVHAGARGGGGGEGVGVVRGERCRGGHGNRREGKGCFSG